MESENTLTYARSSDLNYHVSLRILDLVGKRLRRPFTELLDHPEARHAGSQQELPSDLYVVVQLWADNKPLTIPFMTPHKSFKPNTGYVWSHPITLPITYSSLPLSAQITFTVYDTRGPPAGNGENAVPVGGSTLRLWGRKGTLRKGMQRLYLHPERESDGQNDTTTPSKLGPSGGEGDEVGRLEKLRKKHEKDSFRRIDWLDALAYRQIAKTVSTENEKSEKLFLYVDLPQFDSPVVFSEHEYPQPKLFYNLPSSSSSLPNSTQSTSTSTSRTTNNPNSLLQAQNQDSDLFPIVDPEIARDNPVEAKHRRLVRSHRSGPLDRELKPDAVVRDDLNEILRYPPTRTLTSLQKDQIWKFRFYLTRDDRALTKFLKSVEWNDQGEVSQAVEVLLPMWTEIGIDDALELLGPANEFRDRRVRSWAVRRIARADDDELMLYLLQLVQALKFDQASTTSSSSSSRHHHHHHHRNASVSHHRSSQQSNITLEEFLIERSVKNPVLGNHFYWYLMVEIADKNIDKMYAQVAFNFVKRIEELPDGAERRATMVRQASFVESLSKLAREIRFSKDIRPKKINRLRAAINDPKLGLGTFPSIPLPLDARISITGIDAEKSSIFKSNLFPFKLSLLCENGMEFPVIFKNGDDMRQDQLVIQLFTLMDRLLRKENLDLKLMMFKVLATGPLDGMVQFVPSKTVGDIVSEYGGSLLNYLREHSPDEGSVGTYGVNPAVLDTYIRSCAGYCVVTYLLGVGDRHLDNLLLSPDGHFFHVDFGYILGRDPKPFPPAVKLSKEMVDAMGGMQSPHFARFKNLCFTAFINLRKNANLIINLVALMTDANIPDFRLEPDKAVMKVQERFHLELSEEEAIKFMEGILNETSSWGAILDRIHSTAQKLRA